MGSVAFLFAGQGAQHPAMGVDLIETSPAAAEVFTIADEVRPGTSEPVSYTHLTLPTNSLV